MQVLGIFSFDYYKNVNTDESSLTLLLTADDVLKEVDGDALRCW